MAWLVAVNPAAGRRPRLRERVERALAEAGVEAEVEMPPDQDTMRKLLAEAAITERLAVVGGDGTVNLAVNVLLEQGGDRLPVLGVLPAGTGCDLLRTFGIPQTLEGSVGHLRGDSVYDLDIGEVQGEWGVRRFVNVAQAGVGAAAVETSARLSRWFGTRRYLLSFALRLPRFPGGHITLTTDRRGYEGNALAVIFANGQFFAGGWNVAPKAMLVDGAFDLQVIDVAKTDAPSLVPKLVKGLHLGHPGVRRIVASEFRLETEFPWPVEVDGDAIGNTPVVGRVLPAAIQLKI